MRAMHAPRGRLAGLLALALVPFALALPAAALAHAMLESAVPAVGATVETPPPVVSATFDDDLGASKSSIEVIGPDGASIAKGGVSADAPKTLSVEVPVLAAGTYGVRWVAESEDGHLERGQYEFAVAAGASSGPTTTAVSSAPTSNPPSSGVASPASAYAPPGTAMPSASTAPGDGSGGSESAGQILVIAVVGLGLGLGVGWWRSRRSG
jgi:methionine-rich copper-binding protein CopC